MEGEGLQEVLRLSEGMIGNTINISDSAMNLIGGTTLKTDDPISLRLRENGFHPEETVEAFKRSRCLRDWNERTDVFISDYRSLGPYTTVNKVFKFRDTYFMHVVMVCDHRPCGPGVLDLFRLLLDFLEVYVDRERKDLTKARNTYESLLLELMENKIQKRVTIEERALLAGIPFTGHFRVLKIEIPKSVQLSIDRMRMELLQVMSDSVIIHNHKSFVILNWGGGCERCPANENGGIERLKRVMDSYQAHCGISMEITTLADFYRAYCQASLALKYSIPFEKWDILPGIAGDSGHPRIWYYEQYALYYMVGEQIINLEFWKESPYWTALNDLYQYDREHHTNNVEILYIYLRNERHSSRVGAQLHMHRNNVAYRIGRIEEMLNLDLEDADVRISLLLAFIACKLNEQDTDLSERLSDI